MITHDEFRTNIIQNGRQFFSLSSLKSCMIANLLLRHTPHIHHIPPNNFWLHFDSHINNPLISRATNKEILFSAFQEKVSS